MWTLVVLEAVMVEVSIVRSVVVLLVKGDAVVL